MGHTLAPMGANRANDGSRANRANAVSLPYVQAHGRGFRARVRGSKPGPIRDTQEQAHQDALDIRARRDAHKEHRRTIRDAIDLQLRVARDRGRRDGTIRFYRSHHRTLLRYWPRGRRALAEIDRDEILDFIRGRRHHGVSETTIRHEVTLIGRLFRLAMREGWVVHNPVDLVDRPSVEAREPEFLTFEEIEVVTQGIAPIDADLIRLLFATGLRAGEACHLMVSDVDLARASLRVTHGKRRPRTLPMPPQLVELVRRLRTDDHRLVGGASLGARTARLRRACDAAKRAHEDTRIRPHVLRHSCGSHLARCGVAPHLIGAILGHANGGASITNRYVHAIGPDMLAAMSTLWSLPGHQDPGVRLTSERPS